jgi:predicted AlkP superfamily phosphohydrolase/phosphomutase
MEQESFDLIIVVFTASDRMAHFLWKYMDKKHPEHPLEWSDLLGDALPVIYRRLDAAIGELWEKIGKQATVLIVSDHGSGPLWKRFYANQWLRQNGYLAVRALPFRLASVRYPWQVLRLFNGIARRMGLPHQNLPIGRWCGPIDAEAFDPRFFIDAHLVIDWSRTRAYSGNGSEYGIFVNLKNREPSGIVSRGTEYDALVDELRHGLLSLLDDETGEPVISHVWRRDEIYSGPHREKAPDLVLRFDRHRYALSPDIFPAEPLGAAKLNSGTHTPLGIFLATGAAIEPSRLPGRIDIIDVAPTVLHLLDIPIPANMEGRVVEELLTQRWRSRHPVRKTTFAGGIEAMDGTELTSDERAQVEAHLRSLGYLG